MRRLFLILGLLFLVSFEAFASSEGPTSPGTMSDDPTVGVIAWTDPDNSKVSDDVYSTVAVSVINSPSDYLEATNFSFALTGCTSVTGITAEIEKSTTGSVIDNSVKLVIGGAITGNEKADAGAWPGSDAYTTYGGSSDLWGTAPSCADVRASNFGIGISAARSSGVSPTAKVDHIRMTITYTTANGITANGVTFIGVTQA